MRRVAALALCTCLMAPSASLAQSPDAFPIEAIAKRDLKEFKEMLPGTYSNEEQVYFHGELDLPEASALPRLDLVIATDGEGFSARTLDPATGRATDAQLSYRVEGGAIRSVETREGQPTCERTFTRGISGYRGTADAPTPTCGSVVEVSEKGFVFGAPENPFVMRRARAFTCWISPQKEDGEYGFEAGLVVHDQGGRAWTSGEDAPRVGIKIRNVVWPAGRNRDSLVLYAYRGGDAESAVSYTWTSPDADRIAINLRWMQASCTLSDA